MILYTLSLRYYINLLYTVIGLRVIRKVGIFYTCYKLYYGMSDVTVDMERLQ